MTATPDPDVPPVPVERRPVRPWVVGGIVLVLGLCGIGTTGWYLVTGALPGEAGTYSASGVEDACDLVDPSVARTWADTTKRGPTDQTLVGYRSSQLSCGAAYEDGDDPGQHAEYEMSASIGTTGKAQRAAYGTVKGGAVGDVEEIPDLGDAAYTDVLDLEWPDRSRQLFHTLGVYDDNLYFTIRITVTAPQDAVSADQVAKVAQQQARQLIRALR